MFVYGLLDKSVGDGKKTQTKTSQQIPRGISNNFVNPILGLWKITKKAVFTHNKA